MENEVEKRHAEVSAFYAESLATQGANCCVGEVCQLGSVMPARLRKAMPLLPENVRNVTFGCSTPVPVGIKGKTIVDLGSGAGRDCYLAATQVGPHGTVVGVDMTDDMLSVARSNISPFAANLGWRPNMNFLKGSIEDLTSAGVKANSADVVISNCVVNLTVDKSTVLRAVHEVLRNGGEMYFADIYTDRRLPESATKDKQLVGECLGGAMYFRDFERTARMCGFPDVRVLSVSAAGCSEEARQALHGVNFMSVTYRLFKLNGLEDSREDYGETATYLGSIEDSSDVYEFDNQHKFEEGKPLKVDGNLALILRSGWLSNHFSVQNGPMDNGGEKVHLGRAPTALDPPSHLEKTVCSGVTQQSTCCAES